MIQNLTVLFLVHKCSLPIGVSTGQIRALQMTSSSFQNGNEPHKARLGGGSFWCSQEDDLKPMFMASSFYFHSSFYYLNSYMYITIQKFEYSNINSMKLVVPLHSLYWSCCFKICNVEA